MNKKSNVVGRIVNPDKHTWKYFAEVTTLDQNKAYKAFRVRFQRDQTYSG